MDDDGREKRWTSTFERLPVEKRTRVLEAAKAAFAAQGFTGANINRIAESAGISVGSMYKYFRTKEDLFLALIEESHEIIADAIDGILAARPDFRGRVEALLRAAVETSRADPERVRLYIACTTEELAPLAGSLSMRIEAVSAVRYRAMVAEAKAKGEVDPAIDEAWAAFFLDDILLIAQFSAGSVYYAERLRIYLGKEAGGAGAEVAQGELVARLLEFVMRGLSPRRDEP